MRVHGIESLGASRTTIVGKGGTPPWVKPLIALAVVGVVLAGYLIWSESTPDAVGTDVARRPLEPSELAGHLRRLKVSPPEDLSDLLVADEAIEEMAERATSGKSGNDDKARAVVRAIRARASKQAFVPWSLSTPRESAPMTAAEAYAEIKRDGGRKNLYPLEVAAVAVAALRSAGVDAMIAEIYTFPGDRSPPDPSGYFGYYGVAVYPDEAGEGTPKIYDPYGGREVEPERNQLRVLTDVQAVGAAVNVAAIHRLVRDAAPERAFEISADALALDGRSPNARGVRGTVLIASGARHEAVREFESAAELRPDAPRKNNLASVLLVAQETERATREVGEALEMAPEFAAAHATMAALHLSQQESGEARRELELAERFDPQLAMLPMLWANYFMAEGDNDEALQRARDGVQRQPENVQGRLLLASLYREAGQYAEMRAEARAILERVPESQRDQLRAALLQRLGPTVFDEEEELTEEELEEEEEEVALEGGSEFQLGSGSLLLGGEGGGTSMRPGPSLMGDEMPDPLLPPSDPSTLRLREPGTE
jgi:tetratricopeptide (TPR) repeat protein